MNIEHWPHLFRLRFEIHLSTFLCFSHTAVLLLRAGRNGLSGAGHLFAGAVAIGERHRSDEECDARDVEPSSVYILISDFDAIFCQQLLFKINFF